MKNLKDKLRHHITVAIERGEAKPITSKPYNGWANYETWNVALWIGNDEGLYNMSKHSKYYGYRHFVACLQELGGGIAKQTPDGVSWDDSKLDIDALNEMLRDF